MAFFDAAKRDFSSLSIKDLLDARDTYHIHLAQRENVIATAIGRFYIRRQDKDSESPGQTRKRDRSPARTLDNSVIKSWSWPCVLVFVSKWLTRTEMRTQPEQVIPSFLYLADGRVIPTCVILAQRLSASRTLDRLTFPSGLIGGGYPVLTDVQGQLHVGSLGCLVTDGDSTFALTNAHVTGEAGREVFTLVRGERRRVGAAHAQQVGRVPFDTAYPGWSSTRSQLNVDAGLVRVDELSTCTAQVFGIGELGPLIDLNVNTMSLDFIGCPVRAFGGASGELRGRVQALFYRYRSVGGVDYVADMLIGSRTVGRPLVTRPGDSGTLWFFDSEDHKKTDPTSGVEKLRPLALQWGGDVLGINGSESRFALATCLSTVCRILDVEVVTDFNTGQPEYWGRVGHYKIAGTACRLVASSKLRTLMRKNLDRIAFSDADIGNGEVQQRFELSEFAPLADVPDLKWKRRGAAFARPKDGPTHFADMDQEGFGPFAGKNLLEVSKSVKNINPKTWDEFYSELQQNSDGRVQRGSLPFRIAQFYNEMVEFVSQGKVVDFVCAAGLMAHYVGDACQPLHASHLHNGPDGDSGVHSAFETTMLDKFAIQIIEGVNQRVGSAKIKGTIGDGHGAAVSTVRLIRKVRQILSPETINDVFDDVGGRERVNHLFAELGERTMDCMAEGAKELARLWDSAWREGGGDSIGATKLVAVSKAQLRQRYERKTFCESLTLREMAARGIGMPPAS